jgi:16S rRNA pseudouridine516 synthase
VRIAELLFTQGFGTRRECDALVLAGLVQIAGAVRDDPDGEVDAEGLHFLVRGEAWSYRQRALLVLNKPPGYECSQKAKHHPSIYSLLPAPLRSRGVQAVGRLDEDTTGTLIFTDDGTLIHRLTSPKRHTAKVYEVGCKHAVDAAQVDQLLRGVLLRDDNETVRAAACEAVAAKTLRLTLVEGKYHQVKRMVAAAGNRVEALHRSDFAGIRVDDLAAGSWRWLSAAEETALLEKVGHR